MTTSVPLRGARSLRRIPDTGKPARIVLFLFAAALLFALLAGCTQVTSELGRVRKAGELVMVTVNSPTTYYEGTDGYQGLEYDMARSFAEHLGVELRVLQVDNFSDVIPALLDKKADLAAAGLTITDARRQEMHFTVPYQKIRQQVVYRTGKRRPKKIEDLYGRDIEIPAGTSYADRLTHLQKKHTRLEWTESPTRDVGELLEMVWEGLIEFTVADSHIVTLNQQHFPELRVAFDLTRPEPLAWAVRKTEDTSLLDEANNFLGQFRRSGELKVLLERYYGANRSNPFNMSIYKLRIQNRLPNYQTLFEEAGEKYELDWRLLAAVGYQESFWNPKSISPTGVRGLMMLTKATAKQLGVRNRLSPRESIFGGARYIRQIYDRMSQEIEDPDRMWMALAAYNVGFQHLQDARHIARMRGADPNKWLDVEKQLPLLAQTHWFRRVKYGYARGWEPVRYVGRIRRYYDVLRKVDEEEQLKSRHEAMDLKAPIL